MDYDFELRGLFINGVKVKWIPGESSYSFSSADCSNDAEMIYSWNPINHSWEMDIFNLTKPTSCVAYFTTNDSLPSDIVVDDSNSNNPNTGAFVSYSFILFFIVLAVVVIRNVSRRRKFYRI